MNATNTIDIPIDVQIERGKRLAEILQLKKDSKFEDRYKTEWGSKTALGLFHTVHAIINGA